jgi:hypothetical protein
MLSNEIGLLFLDANDDYNMWQHMSNMELFVLAVLIAPIKETICYQFIPKLFLGFIGIRNYIIVLLILGISFSLLHAVHTIENNLPFSIFFTVGCIVLVNYYMQVQKRENTLNAIVKTILLHSLGNLTTFLLYQDL